MSRALDFGHLSPGDTIVVEVARRQGDTAISETKNSEIIVQQCQSEPGELVQAEIVAIDRSAREITAIPEHADSPVEEYTAGDTLTVSVDNVVNENAHVSLGPNSTLKVVDYPYESTDVEVVVTNIRDETVLTRRLIEIDELSRSQLVAINQTDTVEVRVSPDLSITELNVFISHLLAAGNWDILEDLFLQHADTDKANISLATDALKQQSAGSLGLLRDILNTALADKRGLAPVFGVEYLGAVIHAEAYPSAWENNVKGNFAVYCSNHDTEPSYTSITPVDQLKVESTIDANQLFVEGRQSEARDHSINRELRHVWDEYCAVCGHQAQSRHDKTGIEGSHIYPVKFGGPDQVGNILPMCRNDHWAFENGWIAITDEYTVEFHPELPEDVAGLLQVDPGEKLFLQEGYEPNWDYIVLHRRIHGFDPIQVGHRFPLVIDNVGVKGAQTTFPSGETVVIPYEAIGERDSHSLTVVITDVSDETITAVPVEE
jgi:hypothetical protein